MNRRLDRFELVEPIGPGGQSMVWKAEEHLGDDAARPAAVKILQGMNVEAPEAVKRLRQEAESLIAMSSAPNIVEIRGFGIDEGTPWIAMEYLPQSLEDVITGEPGDPGGPGDPAAVRKMICDVASGLHVMHAAGMLHRDIKPANILQTQHGDYKIADFGLAGSVAVENTVKTATVRYSAPESLDATESAGESPASDLYSLGCVAYAMALGREAFAEQFSWVRCAESGENLPEEIRKWMSWHLSPNLVAKPLDEALPGFPAVLSEVVAKLMAKPLENRFQSAEELLGTLQHWIAPVETAPAGPNAGRPGNKRTLRLAAVLAASFAGLGTVSWLTLDPDPEITLDQPEIRALTPDLGFSGMVTHFPEQARLYLNFDGAHYPIKVDASGRFAGVQHRDTLQSAHGTLTVNQNGEELASHDIVFQRLAPDSVRVIVQTVPVVSGVELYAATSTEVARPRAITDGKGRATLVLRAQQQFRLVLDHPEYELESAATFYGTGIDAEAALQVALRRRFGLARFELTPPEASLRIEGEELDDAIDLEAGLASRNLPPGSYTLHASAPGFRETIHQFSIDRGDDKKVRIVLLPEPPPTVLPALVAAPAGELWLFGLSVDELLQHIKEVAPLAGLRFQLLKIQNVVRVTGAVLNEDELLALTDRLAEVMPRVRLGVRVDAEHIRRLIQRDLRRSGGSEVLVKGHGYLGERMIATFTITDALPASAALRIASGYVLDPGCVEVRGYPR